MNMPNANAAFHTFIDSDALTWSLGRNSRKARISYEDLKDILKGDFADSVNMDPLRLYYAATISTVTEPTDSETVQRNKKHSNFIDHLVSTGYTILGVPLGRLADKAGMAGKATCCAVTSKALLHAANGARNMVFFMDPTTSTAYIPLFSALQDYGVYIILITGQVGRVPANVTDLVHEHLSLSTEMWAKAIVFEGDGRTSDD